MNYNEMEQAVRDAHETIRRGDIALRQTSRMLSGRLKAADIDSCVLDELKRELRNWDMQKREWKQ